MRHRLMPARRKATEEEQYAINALLARTKATPTMVSFASMSDKSEAHALAKAIAGYHTSNRDCLSCNITALNILHEAVNLPPIDSQAHDPLYSHRMALCSTCPAYHHESHSCGRLVLDAIAPIPVDIDGQQVNPCGCFLPVKARLKRAKCPASRW